MPVSRFRTTTPTSLRFIKMSPPGAWQAAIIDVETTGLDPRTDEVIELAALLFAFDPRRGTVHGVLDVYSGLREPLRSIPQSAVRVHGITDEVVRGQRLNTARILSLLGKARFVIAHNANFDRSFVSRHIPAAAAKPWLCSMHGIDWYGRGHGSRSLQALLRDHRVDVGGAHRALSDARALLILLSHPSPAGGTNLSELLRRQPLPMAQPFR